MESGVGGETNRIRGWSLLEVFFQSDGLVSEFGEQSHAGDMVLDGEHLKMMGAFSRP